VIERQDSGDLALDRGALRLAVHLAAYDAVLGGLLTNQDTGVPTHVIEAEGQAHYRLHGLGTAGVWAEAEAREKLQPERSAGDQLKRRHLARDLSLSPARVAGAHDCRKPLQTVERFGPTHLTTALTGGSGSSRSSRLLVSTGDSHLAAEPFAGGA
jgi:hypothetical protein